MSMFQNKVFRNKVFSAFPAAIGPIPLLKWLFTDGIGSTITAVQGPNGTTTATWSTNLPGGFSNPPYYSLQYDGTTSTAISNTAVNYGGNTIITVDMYVYSIAWSTSKGSLLDNGNAGNGTSSAFNLAMDGFGDISCYLNDSSGNANFWLFNAPTVSGWHHIKACYNQTNGNISVSIDGVNEPVGTKVVNAWTTPTIISNNVTTIGNTQTIGGPNNFFTGNIAQVQVVVGDTH